MIGLSVKGKYGVAAMMDLATAFQAGPIQIKSIADRHHIPQNYLERLLTDLKRAGLVHSYRGNQGGYELRKNPKDITIYQILECLEGPINLAEGHKGCKNLNSFWQQMNDKIKEVFSLTLTECLAHKQLEEKMLTYSI